MQIKSMSSKSLRLKAVGYPTGVPENPHMTFQVVNGNLWLTQNDLATLFETSKQNISHHLSNVFAEGELEKESAVKEYLTNSSSNSQRAVKHYSLDAAISVGYRVNSATATKFRIWATQILKRFVVDGFVIDEERMQSDPEALKQLAQRIRALRSTEKAAYAVVRDCFKIASSDYEPSSDEFRSFYSLLQDKFHHAVTSMTASQLVMDRADYTQPKMGLEHTKRSFPTASEAKIGKNYLSEDELRRQYILSEQFLLHAESTALQGKSLTMAELHQYLDDLLVFNGYELFGGYQDFLKNDAERHAKIEFMSYVKIQRLKALGLAVKLDAFEAGEYQDYYEEAEKISMKRLTKLAEEQLESQGLAKSA